MVAGYDRYFQLARCFRDEDLRADRQPEFTQMDMELSFVDIDDVIDVNERLLQHLWKEILGIEISVPFRRMKWIDAMNRFGSDKPDLRFGMELVDVSSLVKESGFGVFADCVKNGGYVRCITVKGQADMPRKKIDALTEFVRGYGLKGLAYIQLKEGGTKCSFAKFMTPEEISALADAAGAQTGDLVLFGADKFKLVSETMGALRCHLARELDLIDRSKYEFLWIVEFPQFEWSEEENRFQAMHHPFTMPMEEDLEYLDPSKDLSKIRAKAYDIVLNGAEIGGGSVRIHQSDIQEKMFECLGFTREQANEQFSFLLNAFRYGVPPHAGLAYGLDRVVMMMLGLDSIRDVIAFPKVKDSSDLMTQAPGQVSEKQLEELGIMFRQQKED
jgi:aspartyl-tRNA synthetase